MLTINTVGPTIMDDGTPSRRSSSFPRSPPVGCTSRIGYSEPDAGTDLASLTTRAVRDGDEYIINGQKTWTSLALGCDYIWLAARTDPNVSKHKGISPFVIPIDTPGITLEPLNLLSSHNINHTFFDDVRVPASSIIGEENQGWRLITSQLNRERVTRARLPPSSVPSRTRSPGRRRPPARTAPGSSTSHGCVATWPRSPPSSSTCAC